MTKNVNNSCSIKGVIKKFNELKYMTEISHTISTGNKFIDKNIAKYGSKIIGTAVNTPKGKLAIKVTEKVYPYVEKGGANIARARAAYNEVFNKKK